MATSAISGADLTKLRSEHQWVDAFRFNIVPLVTVQTGLVTNVPITSEIIQITWDGSTTGILEGQYVQIRRGTVFVTDAVIRKAPSGSTLFISTTPLGSGGVASRIEQPIQVGDSVTIYTRHPLRTLYSRIANNQFLKRWDLAYTNQNSVPPPVANTGEWQSATITSGTASFRLPRFGSNTSFAFGAATITTYAWMLPVGVTLKAGFALSDSIIEVDAVAGKHLLQLTVTDSNAVSHTAFVWLFVSDESTQQSFGERFAIQSISMNQTQRGFTATVTVRGDASLQNDIYPFAGVLINQDLRFNGESLSDGVAIDSFIGYITDSISFTDDGNIWEATFTIASPTIVADSMPLPQQVLIEKANPTNWTEASSVLTNPRGYLYYILKWHAPAFLDMHDFDAPLTIPRKKSAQFNTTTVGAAMNIPAQFIVGNVGSAANGTTVLRQNPLFFDNTGRNALINVITWLEQDLSRDDNLRYQKRWGQAIGTTRTGSFGFDGTNIKGWAAFKNFYQGIGSSQLPDFSVTVAQGLQRVLEIVGHHIATENSDIQEIPLASRAQPDVIDPVFMLWNSLNISADFDPLNIGFNGRTLPVSVNREWTQGQSRLIHSFSVKPETFGQPGKELPIGSARSYNQGGWSSTKATPYVIDLGTAFSGNGLVLAVNDSGDFAKTEGLLNSSPDWTAITAGLDGNVNDATFDFNSLYFANANDASQPLAVYVVTTNGTTLNVYAIEDILALSAPVLLATETMADSTVTTEARIETNEENPLLVLVAWKDRTGTRFIRSTDGGNTFSSPAYVDATISDSVGNDNASLGLAIKGDTQLITAPNGTPEYGLYRATTAGGLFSAVPNTTRNNAPMPMVKIADDTLAYASDKMLGSPPVSFGKVTFDVGGYSSFTNQAINLSGASVTTGGNPGDCYRGGTLTGPSNGQISTRITFVSPIAISEVSVDFLTDQIGPAVTSVEWRIVIFNGAVPVLDINIDTGLADTAGVWTTKTATGGNTGLWSPPYTGDFVNVLVRVNTASGVGDVDIRMDNIDISSAAVAASASLQKITDYTGAATWLDVSPVANQAPARPHDLTIDRIDLSLINTVADNDIWYQSVDDAANWISQEVATAKRTFVTQGDATLVGGDDDLLLSLDAQTNFDDKRGNLSVVWTLINKIKRLLVL
jgi:hypothetical protein